jgi:hypothetical protein
MDDTVEDMVSRFLLGEQRLLEKEIEGEPTTGQREPTPARFALVNQLYEEHRRSPMSKDELGRTLQQMAGDGSAEQQDQASQMLERWDEHRQLGQTEPRREALAPAQPAEQRITG